MNRIALLADIHGNLPALEAVLDDLKRFETPDAIWVLGDLAAFFPWGHEVIECLMSQPTVRCLQGNTDRYLVTGQRHTIEVKSKKDWEQYSQMIKLRDESFRWMTEQLTYQDYCYLRGLPHNLDSVVPGFGRIRAVHGVLGDDETGIFPEMAEETVKMWSDGIETRLWLTGHTHIPMDCSFDGIRIVNPGSVGMGNGNQFTASYSILDFYDEECRVALNTVGYDGEKVISKLKTCSYPGASGLLHRMEKDF